jgi:UDP-N-acetylmuramoylalanine--D-glutamate ligase
MNAGELSGKRLLVLGLGETGMSIARFAQSRGAAAIRVADTRADPPYGAALGREVPEAQFHSGPYTAELFDGSDLIAISPGVPAGHELIRAALGRGVPLVGDIELFAAALPRSGRPTILAVTGTNGKSTVTELTGALLRAAGADAEVAGNIGPAALDALLRRQRYGRPPEVWVLELSSYQLEHTGTLDPDAAAMLNLSEDHLDRYAGIDAYAAAKARIFQGRGVQVLNRDDAASIAMRGAGRMVVTFGLGAPTGAADYGLLAEGDDVFLARGTLPLCPVSSLRLAGMHNVSNALAALALAGVAKPADAAYVTALREFAGLPHRVERVAVIGQVVYYDDSKGTNVGSTAAALRGLGEPLARHGGAIVLIAGGDGKGQNFMPLAEPVRACARAVVLIGRDADRIAQALVPTGVALQRAATMDEAVRHARVLARPGDAVLLSPACASFDMFRNYAHRAEVFVAAVRALQTEAGRVH